MLLFEFAWPISYRKLRWKQSAADPRKRTKPETGLAALAASGPSRATEIGWISAEAVAILGYHLPTVKRRLFNLLAGVSLVLLILWGMTIGSLEQGLPPTLTLGWHLYWHSIDIGCDPDGSSITARLFRNAKWMPVLLEVLPFWWICHNWKIRKRWKLYFRTKFSPHYRRIAAGLCPICGYDLRATPDQCPECGAIPDEAKTTA
jgi:hypothetical protein